MFRKHAFLGAVAVVMSSSTAMAGSAQFLDFDDLEEWTHINTQFVDQGVIFDGDLFRDDIFGDFDFFDPVVRDLTAIWGGDADTEAVAPGLFGLATATLSFEAVEGSVLEEVSFEIARRDNQEITVHAFAADGQEYTEFFDAPGWTGLVIEEFEVDLDVLFGANDWIGVAVHNGGGQFAMDDLSFLRTPVVPGAGVLATIVPGLAGLRGRRGRG